ncbi:MAG: nucleoside hydrolase [Spirochaetia bacterium]|nr:nucleoside hydrolase [Spirochaetia bacterium]
MKRKIIVDTDPGHDDALAILLAAQHFDLLGVTTVFGNQAVEKTTRNALQLLELAELVDVPVIKGNGKPLVQETRYGSYAHGKSGLDGPVLPEPRRSPRDGHASDFIIEMAHAHKKITLVPIGPLTNIALALRKDPSIVEEIEEISLMGGTTMVGNSTPVAELNVWCDPEAAHIVFTSGIPIKMVGLNLTRQTYADESVIEKFRGLGSNTGKAIAELLTFYTERVRKLFGLRGASLHDPCAVAWLIDPSLIEFKQMHVAVELQGKLTRGMTVCDQRNLPDTLTFGETDAIVPPQKPNAQVGITINVEEFINLLIDSISVYP